MLNESLLLHVETDGSWCSEKSDLSEERRPATSRYGLQTSTVPRGSAWYAGCDEPAQERDGVVLAGLFLT